MPFLNSDVLDDPLLFEVCPTWSGGQVSFVRANQLEETQSSKIDNCSIDLAGLLSKRRGTRNLKEATVSGLTGKRIQAVFWWATATEESLIAFTNTKAYEFISGAYSLLFDASVNDPDEAISVVQLSDDLYWTDSSDTGIRKWTGTTVSTVATSPVATILESFTNRLIASGAVASPDTVHFSDLLNSAVWNVNNKVRVGADGDAITALKGWQDALVIVFKEHSTWVIDATPTLTVANFPIKNVHRTVGCLAKRSIAQVGQDLWFLSRSGVQSLQRQFATSNNVIAIPVGQPVHDVIQTINWSFAYKSVGIFYNNTYLLAIPTEGAIEPNTILAYFYLTQSWATWSGGFGLTAFCEQPIEGRTRLVFGNSGGELKELLDNEDESDDPSGPLYVDGANGIPTPFLIPRLLPVNQVVCTMRTRALVFSEPVNPKSGFYLEAEFRGHYGFITINAIIDGRSSVFLESFELGPQGIFLPVNLPVDLPGVGWKRRIFALNTEEIPPFREIQIEVIGTKGNMVLRNLTLSAFADTIEFSRASKWQLRRKKTSSPRFRAPRRSTRASLSSLLPRTSSTRCSTRCSGGILRCSRMS
jgi:hypothetical protein